MESQQGHTGGGGQGCLCPEDAAHVFQLRLFALSPMESLCAQRGALLETAELLGFVPVGGLRFRRGVMLGNGGQHEDDFWEGQSCRAVPEVVLEPPDLLFDLE